MLSSGGRGPPWFSVCLRPVTLPYWRRKLLLKAAYLFQAQQAKVKEQQQQALQQQQTAQLQAQQQQIQQQQQAQQGLASQQQATSQWQLLQNQLQMQQQRQVGSEERETAKSLLVSDVLFFVVGDWVQSLSHSPNMTRVESSRNNNQIRSAMGDFNRIRVAAKHAVRPGLVLSGTSPTVALKESEVVMLEESSGTA